MADQSRATDRKFMLLLLLLLLLLQATTTYISYAVFLNYKYNIRSINSQGKHWE